MGTPCTTHTVSTIGGARMGSTEGKMDKGKGRIKEAVGDLTDNDSLKNEGRADRVGGAAEENVDHVKDMRARDCPLGAAHGTVRLAPVPESAARGALGRMACRESLRAA